MYVRGTIRRVWRQLRYAGKKATERDRNTILKKKKEGLVRQRSAATKKKILEEQEERK